MSEAKSPSDKLPSSSMPNSQDTSDLMNRLQAFLPQMKAANQALEAENPPRVDLELKSETDDDNDEEEEESNPRDSDDESSTDKQHATTEAHALGDGSTSSTNPTIQIEFALGKMKDNPMMQLLAKTGSDDDDSEESGDSSCGEDEDDTARNRKRAVAMLLAKGNDDELKKGTDTAPAQKKPLISEI